MRKCRRDEVPALVVAMAQQCVEGVQFNWVEFLCEEFLTKYKEAQEYDKNFHYAWLLLSILLVTGKLLEDSQFPHIELDLPEGTKYVSLWATKDGMQIHETKIFWVLIEASIRSMPIPHNIQQFAELCRLQGGYAQCVYQGV